MFLIYLEFRSHRIATQKENQAVSERLYDLEDRTE